MEQQYPLLDPKCWKINTLSIQLVAPIFLCDVLLVFKVLFNDLVRYQMFSFSLSRRFISNSIGTSPYLCKNESEDAIYTIG